MRTNWVWKILDWLIHPLLVVGTEDIERIILESF